MQCNVQNANVKSTLSFRQFFPVVGLVVSHPTPPHLYFNVNGGESSEEFSFDKKQKHYYWSPDGLVLAS